jgi:RNA polymerase sigma factor (sigma-70 family)
MGVLFSATPESLDSQISAAQLSASDDTPDMACILARFEGLAIKISRALTADWSRQQDAAQGARIGLIKAVRNHKAGTPGFAAYAARYMRGEAQRTLAFTWSRDSFIDPADYEILGKTESTSLDTSIEFIDLISGLLPKQQAIVKARYLSDAGLRDIASALGISKPAVSQQLATIHRNLRNAAEMAVAA